MKRWLSIVAVLSLLTVALTVALIIGKQIARSYTEDREAELADFNSRAKGVSWSLEQIENCSWVEQPPTGYGTDIDPQNYLDSAHEVAKREIPFISIDEAKAERQLKACYIKMATEELAYYNGTRKPPYNLLNRREWKNFAELNANRAGLSLVQLQGR